MPKESLFDHLVSTLIEAPMPGITTHEGKPAGYGPATAVIRRAAEGSPLYTAWHQAKGAEREERNYSPSHEHPFPELNILLAPQGELVYRIRLGDKEQEVVSPATILIPPGLPHSANFVEGKGEFIVVRLIPEQIAAASARLLQ